MGFSVIFGIGLFFIVEFALRVKNWVRRTFFVKEVKRKDFIAPGYQVYVDWLENWNKPMFRYIPIGFRFFNNNNPILPVKNNSLGFRCDEFTEPKADELRVMIVGGSAAWSSGASSNEATIAGQLEELINSDRKALHPFKKAKCYNMAQVNECQTQDLLTVLFFAPIIKPHYVISFTGWNELISSYNMKADILKKFGAFYLTEMEEWESTEIIGNKLKLLKKAFYLYGAQRSEAIKMLYSFSGLRNKKQKLCIDEQNTIRIELFMSNLLKMQRLANAFEFKHFQFTQPYLYRKKILTVQEKKIIHLYDDLRPVAGGKEIGDFLRKNNIYLPIVSASQKDSSIGPVIDFCDIFREDEKSMFYTLVHLTDEGYRRIAEGIYETLLKSRSRIDSKEGDYV